MNPLTDTTPSSVSTTATVAHSVRAFTSHAKGWVIEFQPLQI